MLDRIKLYTIVFEIHVSSCMSINFLLLQVNGYMLVGVSHEQAIEVIRTAPSEVKVVVCRGKDRGDSEQKLPHSTELSERARTHTHTLTLTHTHTRTHTHTYTHL